MGVVFACMCVLWEVRKRVLYPLELELEIVVSY